jgi:MoaA/NifB/PqqE/SkfB family radical SAM enzyme
MEFPKNFCIAPFVQHTTHPSGSYSPCPYLGGTSWSENNKQILSQWTSSNLQELRQQFKNNLQPDMCHRCWHEEKNNKRSLRLRLFDPVNHTSDYEFVNTDLAKSQLDDYTAGPRVLTIKNGNVCNARCRSCHPNDSSRWIADSEKLYQALGKKHYNLNQDVVNWSDQQIDQIVELSKNLLRLELFGGEPTYNKKVTIILERIVAAGHAKHITLYINTNGSINITEKWPFVHEFAGIELGVSIDGVGAQFEYIRNGVEWNQLVDNIKAQQSYFKQHKVKYWIDSISTVSILNVYYLPEIKKAVQQLLPLAPFWNLLIKPDHLFIKNMPTGVKQAVISRLGSDPDYAELISVMQQPAGLTHWQEFLEITLALDQIRNENFETVFPEFAQLIARHR